SSHPYHSDGDYFPLMPVSRGFSTLLGERGNRQSWIYPRTWDPKDVSTTFRSGSLQNLVHQILFQALKSRPKISLKVIAVGNFTSPVSVVSTGCLSAFTSPWILSIFTSRA